MAVPIVKIPDHSKIDPRRPILSDVKAWASAPTNVLDLNQFRVKTVLATVDLTQRIVEM